MKTLRLVKFSAVHLVTAVIIVTLLFVSFAPAARLMQQAVGPLDPPERYSSHEELQQWQIYLERGYGEGIDAVARLLFLLAGVISVGFLTSAIIYPMAMARDPGTDPTNMVFPVSALTIGGGAVLLLIATTTLSTLAPDLETTNIVMSAGPLAVGLLILPAFVAAVVGLGLGAILYKRRHFRHEHQDNAISEFYKKISREK